MGFFQLQGSHFYSSSKDRLRIRSSIVLGVILLLHALVIVLVFNDRERPEKTRPEKILRLINVLSKPEETNSVLPELIVKPLQLSHWNPPNIQIAEPVISPLDIQINDSSSELPSKTSGQYENVFDPKMRQKLLDSQGVNRPRVQEKSKTWTAIDGRTFIEMGDGMCMVSMAKMDSRDRANNWGYTTCGKNDSEKAMDRVMADFESRKAPLGKPKSNP
ncbi:hypothetical protein [Cellvibrio sp.]|uniref:hypothetical protein n=1 Tax=Cellvibrio sp. TaxID=1965322 RepID=UPI003964775A